MRAEKLALHTKIIIGLLTGLVLGLTTNSLLGGDHTALKWTVHHFTQPIGELFLRLLLMIVVPLVFSSLVVGIAGMGDIRKIGRVGFKSLVYTIVFTAISVAIGIGLTNAIEPGKRMSPETSQALIQRFQGDAKTDVLKAQATHTDSPLLQVVKTIVPSNPFFASASATPNMLHLMFFALFLAIAMTLIASSSTTPLIQFFESVYAVCAKCIDIVMYLAPFAVACLMFTNTALFGLDLVQALAWFFVTVLLGLSLQMFGVYSLSVYFLSKMNPVAFFKKAKLAILTAFSTSSSSATLPTALKVGEEELLVPKDINTFVLTVGATANQNGTALYEGVTVLFLAQLAGADLTLAQQVMVAYLAILGGIGTAGVPAGSIPFIVLVLTSLKIDPTLIAIILGVDRILDMCRTAVNVTGDLTIATYVARSENRAGQ